jgi:hypothetical protein
MKYDAGAAEKFPDRRADGDEQQQETGLFMTASHARVRGEFDRWERRQRHVCIVVCTGPMLQKIGQKVSDL